MWFLTSCTLNNLYQPPPSSSKIVKAVCLLRSICLCESGFLYDKHITKKSDHEDNANSNSEQGETIIWEYVGIFLDYLEHQRFEYGDDVTHSILLQHDRTLLYYTGQQVYEYGNNITKRKIVITSWNKIQNKFTNYLWN